jgi:tetratricopeptide (TPR) repeat protein
VDEAIAVYHRAREQMGRPSLFALQLADLHAARLNFREATRENLLFLRENPQQWSIVQARVSSYAADAQGAVEAVEVITQELNTSPHQLQLRRILASLAVRMGNWPLAFENFAQIDRLVAETERNRGTLGAELFGFAETARQEQAYEFAEKAYALLLARYPGSPLALRSEFQRAVLLKETGRYQEAISGFIAVADRYPRSREGCAALLEGAAIYLSALHDPLRCQQLLSRLLNDCPPGNEQARALLVLGDARVAGGDLSGAWDAYKQAARSAGAARDEAGQVAGFKMAELAFLTGALDSAATMLTRVSSQGSGKVVNDALQLLLLINENRDDESALKTFAEACLLRRQWQLPRALQLLERVAQRQPVPAIADEAWMEIASIETEQGGYQKALQAYERVYNGFLDSRFRELALKQRAELLERYLADDVGAAKAYEELLVAFPSSVYLEEARKKLRVLDGKLGAKKPKGER